MTNKPHGTLYIGVTNSIERRGNEHFSKVGSQFTKKYNLRRLVYLEETTDISAAIAREKQLKNWHRQWKVQLIESLNPRWENLLALDSETSSE
jgi:putative endonuclease